jgi:ABC-type sugar transport system ATPase subunit
MTLKGSFLPQGTFLEVENISKSFSGVKAPEDVSFDFRRGEVHTLAAEKGFLF